METTTRKTVLAVGALLVVASTAKMAVAAERHERKADRAPVAASQKFRSANDSLAWPSVAQQNWSDYSEGHVISAAAGQ
jgi:hypothetical protein